MGTRIGVAVMAVLMVLYLALAGQIAILLLISGEPVGVVFGVALLVLPLLGV